MSTLAPLPTADFTEEQKAYLTGFVTGVLKRRELPFLGQLPDGRFTHESTQAAEETLYGTPLDDLCREERIKLERHGLDSYDSILANAANDDFPKDGDIF